MLDKPPVHALLKIDGFRWVAVCGHSITVPTLNEDDPEYPAVLYKALVEIQVQIRMAKNDRLKQVTCLECRNHPKFPLLELVDTEL